MTHPGRSTPIATGNVLGLSVWFGLMTGIGSAALIGVQKFVLDDITLSSPQTVWTAPLLAVLAFLAIGALLAPLTRLLPQRHQRRVLILTLSLISCAVGLMIWGKQLSDVAVAILSLGIAVQLSHLAVNKPALFQRIVRVTSIAGIAVVLLATAVVNIGGPLRERHRLVALPEARDGAPNVLIIILDTVRALSMSLYGYERPTTPWLEHFARDATVFDYALAPSPWTLPSHASMFTGVPAHRLSADWTERLDESAPTLAEHFRDRGYRTAGVVGNWFYANSEWGIDRGFLHYSDFTNSVGHALASTSLSNRILKWMEGRWEDRFWFHRLGGRRIAPHVSRDLVRWIEKDRSRPFFAFVNYYDAHDPYVAPGAYVRRFAGSPRASPPPVRVMKAGVMNEANAEQRARTLRHIDTYDAAIAYLDEQIGRLFTRLERGGYLDNTIVVITADHGEEFGENGKYWHGLSMHAPALHVPLVIRFPPRVPAGRRIAVPVTLTDVAATVADLADAGPGAKLGGASLARFWNGGGSAQPVLASLRLRSPREHEESQLRSVFTGDLHYTLSDLGRESLFRYREDPLEQRDLMATGAVAARTVAQLRSHLDPGGPWMRPGVRVTSGGTRGN